MSISLPLTSESVLCSHFSRLNGVDPGGTALAPAVVVLVEVSEPWPKPVAKHDGLKALVVAVQAHPEQVRLLAAIPHDNESPRVIAFRPAVGGMTRAELPLGDDPVGALLAVLTESEPLDVPIESEAARTLLVCTQGSHDICCGGDGVEFADSLAFARPDIEIFRVSHTGGHRFAPTAMSLPDGRMWAYLTTELAEDIVDRRGTADLLAPLCRGWWGAPTGPAQVAERAVFAELGFEADLAPRTVQVDNDGSDVAVHVGDDVFDVQVGVGREVPTIACGALGGQPIKPGREWVVLSGPTKR